MGATAFALLAATALAQTTAPASPNGLDDPLAYARVNAAAQDLTIVVELRTTGELRHSSGRRILLGSQEVYQRSAAVGVIFRATRLWQAPLERLTLRLGDASFAVTAGSRMVVTDEKEILLPVPVLAAEGDLWLPVYFLTEVVGPRIRQTVRWDPEQSRLAIGSAAFNVSGLRVERLTRATAVHVLCSEPLGYRATSTQPDRIDLKIYGAEVDLSATSMSQARGLVNWVRSRQERDYAVVSVGIDDLVGRYRTYTRDEGREIILVLEEEQVAAIPEPVPRGRANVAAGLEPVDVTRTEELRTVVIDPGHGGSDVGATSREGVREKDVNLAVARQLAGYLKRRSDLAVVLTRDADEHLGLAERAEIANTTEGDLFVSLHCNSWFDTRARGFETYFLSPAESDHAHSVAATENEAAGEPSDLDFIVWELVQNRFIASSSDLAEVMQQRVCESLGIPNRGVRQAGFRVLVGAYMPAVLVEMGFLSHSDEARRLGSDAYQRRLAEALGDAILAYRERTARALAASGGGPREER